MLEALTVVFTGVVAASTVAYVILTRQLASETRALRQAETEPQISVYPSPSPSTPWLLDLVITNLGGGPAHDVRFILEEEWTYGPEKQKLSEIAIFNEPLPYLAPGQELRAFLGTSFAALGKEGPKSFRVRAEYQGPDGDAKSEVFPVDFRPFDRLPARKPPEAQIADRLKEIYDVLKRIRVRRGRIPVELWTREDVEEEEERFAELFRKQQARSRAGEEEAEEAE